MSSLVFTVAADISSFASKIAKVQKSVEATSALMERLSSSFDGRNMEQSITGLNKTIAALEEKVTAAKTALDNLQGSSDSSAVADAQAEYDRYSASLDVARNRLAELQSSTTATAQATQSHTKAMADNESYLVKMLGGTQQYNQIMALMPAPIKAAASAVNGLTAASLRFLATPLGAVIGAIVLALQALTTWFNSSKEGQLAFATVSGYVSGVLGQLKEIVIAVGKAIYTAFTDPQAAVSALWKAIKTNFVNRFEAMGGLVSEFGKLLISAFTLDTEGIQTHLTGMRDQFTQLITGVENLTDKVVGYVGNLNEAGKATATIRRETKELSLAYSQWGVERAKMETDMTTALNTARDTTKTEKERLDALAEYRRLNDEIQDTEAEYADKRVAMQAKSNDLTSSTIEDEQALADLQRERVQLENQRQAALRSVIRLENSIRNSGSSSSGGSSSSSSTDSTASDEVEEATNAAKEKLEAEVDAMREYLKEYGTFQEKRAAIAAEYDEKIFTAETEGQRKTLEKQKAAALADVDTAESAATIGKLTAELDWRGITSGMTEIAASQADAMLTAISEAESAGQLGNLTADDQVQLQGIIADLEQYAQKDIVETFDGVRAAGERYQEAVAARELAELQAEMVAEDLVAAQKELREAIADGGDTKSAQEKVDDLTDQNALAQQQLTSATTECTLAINNMKTATNTAKDMLTDFQDGLEGLRSGTLSGIFSGADSLSHLFGEDLSETLSSSLVSLFGEDSALGGILQTMGDETLNAIFAALDILSEGLDTLVVDITDTLFDALNGLLNTVTNILSGDFFVSLGKSVASGVGSILDTVTFGGFSSIFSSSNAEWVAEVTEELTQSNEDLEDAVEALTDELADSAGTAAQETAADAVEAQEQIIEQTMEILQAQMSYHNHHHSNAHYFNDYFTDEDYEALNDALAEYAQKYGEELSEAWSLSEIYELTPEEMNYIRTYYSDIWDAMTSAGKYDKSEYWEAYADLAGSLEEINDELYESLTQTTFDSLYDSFVDTLMDMDADAEDFAEDFAEYMQQALLSSAISNQLSDELEDFYDTWAEYMNADENAMLDEDEIEELSDAWEDIVEEGLSIRDSIAAITGYGDEDTYSQEASTGAWESMSEETAEELNGRFTALQIAGETVAAAVTASQESMTTLVALTSSTMAASQEARTLLITNNSYLEDILKYTKLCYADFGTKFDDMVSSLKKL